jgi:hypothetical protein
MRKNGYYLIKLATGETPTPYWIWTVGRWSTVANRWRFTFGEENYTDSEILEVGERIKLPDEK